MASHISAPASKTACSPAPTHRRRLLTNSETTILRLMISGHCPSEIAQQLFISKRTVEYHLGHIYAKLGVSNRMGAIQQAFRLGVFQPEDVQTTVADEAHVPANATANRFSTAENRLTAGERR